MVLIHRLKNVLLPEKPEVVFNRQLGENPFFPFKTTPENSKCFAIYSVFLLKIYCKFSYIIHNIDVLFHPSSFAFSL